MKIGNGKIDTEEDVEQYGGESDKSSDEDSHTCSTEEIEEDQEDESQSDIDEAECERRRHEYLADMSELEKQFCELKEQLYTERLQQIDAKIIEIQNNKAVEYLHPLAQLEKQLAMKKKVAGIRRDMSLNSIKQKFESEELAAFQHMESEKVLLYDTIKQELQDKIRRLEEDRHNIDITSDLWQETQTLKKKKKTDPLHPDRKKKPQTVTGPYIVYMIREADLMEDWMAVKKAIKQQSQKRKAEL
ncbi:breast cancer metastasis-suppressor 1-like protein-A [Biomphalaria glabrata]|uniref:Breast cancer metastasis-suppressor 1-like protein-A n=2 Tax=Biomphalaria TaxID=6525 RepID=A0A2C9KKT2_BIOGL|nr:breast cancer metastasis-suppressor 1-like protein-A [Biomphalaria glabrata]XP_013094441.1 breast cancer metastasis-suppressor 1-like protein-A [Biomphalaria glabrata]XP_013094443.1 breast cancer metastasis-suppressor 1-like protein-A [Biomphalaria glabrata]XP_055881057.1 breast cancer metastasis-suppressor 1-like protein-A [Biomphalaria glabrata]XP_055881058.1 breast cancer metastasis-suppressor 1-like protein-A [Biomphalaria glabrata]XP_055881059.1 breast cancer metastasis-suppressor 1-li